MTDALPEISLPLRILVVEDHVDSAKSMAALLRMYGHHVQIALNGADALEFAHAYEPDVVLLDIGLPGMDGWTLAGHLGELPYKKRPFMIALTGYGEEEAKKRSVEAGIDLHLLKPVEPELLRSILSRFQAIVR
jgi:two-component system, sensor histidine kinase